MVPCSPVCHVTDIYVFGVGAMVHLENINELASKKPDERHVFYLRDLTDLQQAFHDMIGMPTPPGTQASGKAPPTGDPGI